MGNTLNTPPLGSLVTPAQHLEPYKTQVLAWALPSQPSASRRKKPLLGSRPRWQGISGHKSAFLDLDVSGVKHTARWKRCGTVDERHVLCLTRML